MIYEKYYGSRRRGIGKIDGDSLFRIASISKSVVATIIAKKVAAGLISLDEPVASTIFGVDKRVTIRHILSHSSGYEFSGDQQVESGIKREELIKELFKQVPTSNPGNTFQYNNLLFSLTEEFLTAKTKRNWRDSIEDFLKSLGIGDFSICENPQKEKYAFPHVKTGQGYSAVEGASPYCQTLCASGGVYLSMNGMIKYAKALMGRNPSALNDNARELLFRPNIEDTKVLKWPIQWRFRKNNYKVHYSLGLRVLENSKSHLKLIFHPGYLSGARSFVGFIPELDVGIVILATQDGWGAIQQGIDFWERIIEK